MRTCVLTLVFGLSTCTISHGALYEFTLGGSVTFAAGGDVPIGSPVTIRYTADSRDLHPDPQGGLYAASQATVEFPNFSIQTAGTVGPTFAVGLRDATTSQSLQYLTHSQGWGLNLGFAFPPQTLESDELPLTLPLAKASVASFYLFPIFHEWYAGNITSYTAVEIPEPSASLVLPMTIIALHARKRGVR
jgi:hypothetical protein